MALAILHKQNRPCHYTRLLRLMQQDFSGISTRTFAELLRRCIDGGYMSRLPVSGNVVYDITTEGRELLNKFTRELERLVKDQVLMYGNGFESE